MGIRCYCPRGHKLNVKTEQAGKMGICPVCNLRFQIPFGNAQAPVPEEAGSFTDPPRPTDESDEDLFNLEPLPGLENPQNSTSKSAKDLLNHLNIELKDIEEPHKTTNPLTPPASSGDPESDSEPDVWYILGCDGREYGPMSKSVIRSRIKARRLSDTTVVRREGGPRRQARLFRELAVEKNGLGCGGWLLITVLAGIAVVIAILSTESLLGYLLFLFLLPIGLGELCANFGGKRK